MTQTWNAQCRCGALRVSVSSPPALQLVCHCTDCREVAGTPFSNFVFFRVRDAQVEGETVRREFVADSGSKTVRESCARCGDMLIDRTEGYPKIIGLVAERIAPPFTFEPQHHVWADSKLPEVVIPPDAKVFARGASA